MKTPIDQQNSAIDQNFPEHLRSYESLEQHFREKLDGLSTTEKGDRFVHFVQKLVPQVEIGSDFDIPELAEKKSGDEGVDLIAQGKDGHSILYIQARLWIDSSETIDSIVSKFKAYLATHHSKLLSQPYLFKIPDQTPHSDNPTPHFLVITLSSLKGIRKRYEEREFASKSFYQQLVAEDRIHFIDGHQILSILQAAYSKISDLPTNLVLNLETPPIRKDNVFFGIISSTELQKLYNQFGDALFFENIRDFLGLEKDRERKGITTPNDEIVKTIKNYHTKMLERNNGIVIRADEVKQGQPSSQLILSKGSVVNGCQTTMCLVEYATELCYVPVKIVQTVDSWDIAKAANYQNAVADIDLDLARNLRPQLAKRAATISGVQIDDGAKSAFQIIDEIYIRKVAYREIRFLYIGLFSQTPNNIFDVSYTKLRHDLKEKFYQEDFYGEKTFETLFTLQAASQEGLEEAKATFTNPSYAKMFERFYKEDSPSYRCFVSILALCGVLNVNIAERRGDERAEYERMSDFLSKARSILENRKKRFLRYYRHALTSWIFEMMEIKGDDDQIRQMMYSRSRTANFTTMFGKMCALADNDDWLREDEQQFQRQNT